MAFTARTILILFTLLVVAATFTQAAIYPFCRYQKCYGYHKFNWQTCRCDKCPQMYCHSDAILDPYSCKCLPNARPTLPPSPPTSPPTPPPTCPPDSCDYGQTLDPNTCECVCTQPATCNSLQRFNSDTCKCECVEVIPKPVRLTKTRDDDTMDTPTDTSKKSPGTRNTSKRGSSQGSKSSSSGSEKSSKGGSSRKRRDEQEVIDSQLEAIAGPGSEQDVLEMEKRGIEKRWWWWYRPRNSGKRGSSRSRGSDDESTDTDTSRSPGTRTDTSRSPGTRTGTGSRSTKSSRSSSKSSRSSSKSSRSSRSGSSRKRRDEQEAIDPQLEAIAGPGFEQDVLEMEKRGIEKRYWYRPHSSGKRGRSRSRGRSKSRGHSRSRGRSKSRGRSRSRGRSHSKSRSDSSRSHSRSSRSIHSACPAGQRLNEHTCRCY